MDIQKINAEDILEKIFQLDTGKVNIMEICGTHTMAIARSGLRDMLPEGVRLISGPGCPVCVTPDEAIDAVVNTLRSSDITAATYGDMIRVPGSRGDTLARCRMDGADVRVVYSPMDAVNMAAADPTREVMFLGVGFETTAPGTAAGIMAARRMGLKNFTVLSLLRRVEPAMRTLIEDKDFNVQGFICPGHVATIIGTQGFEFLGKDYGIPSVVSGFDPLDILCSVYILLKNIASGNPEIVNEYRRGVSYGGNEAAMAAVSEVFSFGDDLWRGLGSIPESGLAFREKYRDFDAGTRFGIDIKPSGRKSACRCGDVIQGKIGPRECPLFGKVCTPENPSGPCMVSGEGTCAAEYKYRYQ